MVVKKGYKQTEVGVIPEDWTLTIVRDFAKIITGPFGTLLKASEYSGGNGVPLISVGEIREGYLSVTYETPRVSSDVTRRLPQYVLKEGDIIFGRKGGVDRSALIRQNQVGWFLGSDGIALRPFGRLCQEYASLQFQSKRVQSWLLQHAIGTTMPSLNQTILNNVIIPLPPTLAEQESIAGALSDADAWIESLEQLIAKKRQIKQGAMQELLTGKRRLPGFEFKRGYKQTEVGVIPEDWDLKKLGSIADVSAGGTPSRNVPEYWNGGIPWVTTTELDFGRIKATSQNISALGLKSSAAKLLNPGTILLALYGQGKTRGKVAILDIEATSNQACAAIVLSETFSRPFIFRYLASKYDFIRGLSNTGNQENLNGVIVKSIPIPLPPTLAEQEAIATVLSDMDTEIESLESKLAKAREIKQGMMQELLTGRIRLV